MTRSFTILSGFLAIAQLSPGEALPDVVDFNDHVQPILSEYCYQCHGPDSGTRAPEKEPLRLDLEDEAFKPRKFSGEPVIIKGDAEASELIARMLTDDPDDIMPPPEAHKVMKRHEIELLKKWIDQGAPYEGHWSFQPVERPALPASDSGWSNHPVDRFIEARLDENGLRPNPDADLTRFYRRLHLDLTGLPPSPEDIAAFKDAADADLAGAIAAEADRLLATTASAEHFARHWLDVARYADTHGIHIDNYRAIWPYRDWVIRAFAQNMRWDQFTLEQIAGDLLPEPTLEQKVATGFHRCLPTTGEGGAIAEEYLAIYAQDRTDTTGAVWLGLTMGCASCHDHKFDPITMKDTYSMNAFFRNTPMSALDGNRADHPPNIFVPLPGDRERFAQLQDEIAGLEKALAERRAAATDEFDAWAANASFELGRETAAALSVHLPLNDTDQQIRGVVNGENREWPTTAPTVKSPFGQGREISGEPVVLGDAASVSQGDRVTFGGFVRVEGTPSGTVASRLTIDDTLLGWDLYLVDGKPAVHIVDAKPDATHKRTSRQALKPGQWHHVMVTFDSTKPSGQSTKIYVDGKAPPTGFEFVTLENTGGADVPLSLGARHNGDAKLAGGKVALQDFRFYDRLLDDAQIVRLFETSNLRDILATTPDERTKAQKETLFNHFITTVDEPSRELQKKLEPLKTEDRNLRQRGSISLVMEEKNEEPHAHILNRGVYSDKGERVTAEVPGFLPPMPEGAPKNRLGLAKWLVADNNPLTPRVTMNRLWQQFFGTGIVETAGDFGIMGARPTHPKLLDWLAAEFRDSGWDHRHMVKTLVTSRTYRQAATVTAEKLEIDPDNRLLSRGPRYRLDAEQIRDLALTASGLLSDTVGGPPVKPYQPQGIWEAVAMPQSNTKNYKQDSGEALYRRSLYTFWKRTAPHPAMEILNAPTREVTCVQRERTNTPLQAFVTLNDPQFVEASRHLAEHALKKAAGFDERTDFITLRLLARTLDDEERTLVRNTLDAAAESFGNDPAAATALISAGETPPDPELDPAELAAWTLLASQIFNLDESLNK